MDHTKTTTTAPGRTPQLTPTAQWTDYTVHDGRGGELRANNSFELEAINDGPELIGDQAVLAKGKEDTAYIIKEADLLQGFSDVDGDKLQPKISSHQMNLVDHTKTTTTAPGRTPQLLTPTAQ